MEARPRITIELTRADRTVEVLCLTFLAILWIGTAMGFSKLPEEIPIHFGAGGQANGYGRKIMIFTLPAIATILYIGMSILNRYPHIFNYPATITVENARSQYVSATKLIRTMKLVIVIIFSSIVFMTFRAVFNGGDGLGKWFLPFSLALVFIPLLVYLISSQNGGKTLK